MYFVNENTLAVTENDKHLLFQTCLILKNWVYAHSRHITQNPQWKLEEMDCHCVARVVALNIPELTVEDGYLLGIEIEPDTTKLNPILTNHSWLRTPDKAIIDPYPTGVIPLNPALLIPTRKEMMYKVHGSNYYHRDDSVYNNFDVTESQKTAQRMFGIMKLHAEDRDLESVSSELCM